MKLDEFIKQTDNERNIDILIEKEQKIIREAEMRIEHFKSVKDVQSTLPWYKQEGFHFVIKKYSHSNSYRSHDEGESEYENYAEFVSSCLRYLDPPKRSHNFVDSIDAIIISPNDREIKFADGDIKDLPLFKEYFELKALKEEHEQFIKEKEQLESKILQLKEEQKNTDKYSQNYIELLNEEMLTVEKNLNVLVKNPSVIERENKIEKLELVLHELNTDWKY